MKPFLLLCLTLFSKEEIPFSKRAWIQIQPIYQAILKHPFNLELAKGTLKKSTFDYYKAQDSLYLDSFKKALLILASKLEDPKDAKLLLDEVVSILDKEKKKRSDSKEQPFTLLYTQYLLATAAFKSKEELAAALLPCFWIYLEVAKFYQPHLQRENPYSQWFRFYSSESYQKSVEAMIQMTNRLAQGSSSRTREKMLEAFELASRMEWYFWEGAHRLENWKP